MKGGNATQNFVHISSEYRSNEFIDEFLVVNKNNKNKLFCEVCRVPISLKRHNCRRHIDSKSHRKNKQLMKERESNRENTKSFINEYINKNNIEQSFIDENTLNFRFNFIRSFLKSGIPLSKINSIRPMIEEYCPFKLTDSSHLRTFIPMVLEFEINSILERIEKQYISITFDSTSFMNMEIFAVVGKNINYNKIIN